MKAEQRKELETNALADRMGHLVQRVKTRPRRSGIYYVLGAIAILAVVFVIVRSYTVSREENSKRWMGVEMGSRLSLPGRPGLEELLKNAPETNQGKTARFHYAWYMYWEAGLKRLGVGNGGNAMMAISQARILYEQLAQECANDKEPIWESEALYALAAIEETQALVDPSHLDSALKQYEALAQKHPTSARGELAAEWVKNYGDAGKRREMEQFYDQMRSSLRIPDLLAPKKGLELGKGLNKEPAPK